jgi:hypothetical protein
MPLPNEKLEKMPNKPLLPQFIKVQGMDGKFYPALTIEEQQKYEKVVAYVNSSNDWNEICYGSFNDSVSRTRSVITIAKSTENYANYMILRVEEQSRALEEERNGRLWDNIKNTAIQIILTVAVGLAVF